MPDAPIQYFLEQPDAAPSGPHSIEWLMHQAAHGKIDGTHRIAKSTDGPWTTADRIPALELEWRVEDAQGNHLPVCHILALRGKVEREEIQPFWEIIHVPSGEDYQVVDALCSALLEQNKVLEEHLTSAGILTPEPLPDAEDDANPRELRLRRDQAVQEATKWKRLYEGEIGRNRDREEELLEQIEELRTWQRKAAERLKALDRRKGQLEELMLKTPETGKDTDHDLSRAYQELQIQLEHLMDSLHLRSREVIESQEQNRELRLQLRQARQEHDETINELQEIHSDTLQQLTSMEQAQADLIREFRDLNHRYIQNRKQQKTAPAQPESDSQEPGPPPKPATPPTKLDMS